MGEWAKRRLGVGCERAKRRVGEGAKRLVGCLVLSVGWLKADSLGRAKRGWACESPGGVAGFVPEGLNDRSQAIYCLVSVQKGIRPVGHGMIASNGRATIRTVN
jgi:hypothetical protein